MKPSMLILALSLGLPCIHAADYHKEVADVLALVEKGKAGPGFDLFFQSNRFATPLPADLQANREAFAKYTTDMGAFQYDRELGEYRIAGAIVWVMHLLVYERQTVLLKMQFFRTNAGWIAGQIGFDGQFADHTGEIALRDLLLKNASRTVPNQSSEPTPASGTSPAGQEPRLP